MDMYDLNELVGLVVNTAMGTACYIGIQINIFKQKVSLSLVFWTFCTALFLSHVTTQSIIHSDSWYKYRSAIIPMISLFSTYIVKVLILFVQEDSREILKAKIKKWLDI